MMEEHPIPHTLRRVSILTAVEVGSVLAGIAATILDPPGVFGLEESKTYIIWTLQLLRIAVWALMIVSASRLSELEQKFRRVGILFLLRLLTNVIAHALPGILDLPELRDFIADPASPAFVLFILNFTIFTEILIPPLAVREILNAEADLLYSIGAELQEKRNRRCGTCFLILSLSMTFLYGFFFSVTFALWSTTGALLLDIPDERYQIWALLALAALLLFLLCAPLFIAFWIAGAVRMWRTYRTVKEMET